MATGANNQSRAPTVRAGAFRTLACVLAGILALDACATAIEQTRSSLPLSQDPKLSDAEFRAAVGGLGDFDDSLFRSLSSENESIVYSPASLALALGMTYAAAGGETAQQLAAVLHAPGSPQALHASMARMLAELRSREMPVTQTEDGEKSLTARLAQALWAKPEVPIAKPYLDTLASRYDGGVFRLAGGPAASARAVNKWVSNETAGKIDRLVDEGAIGGAPFLLTTTLYFWGSWASAFDPVDTRDEAFFPFTGAPVQVPMMHMTATLRYTELQVAQILEIPYYGDRVSMIVVLPAKGRFAEARELVRSSWLREHRASLRQEDVALSMPRFRIASSHSLKAKLRELGAVAVFEPSRADLSGMTRAPGVYLSDAVQGATIAVGEEGTEAAAATAMIAKGGGPNPNIKRFEMNRPFVFFILDATDITLLRGQVVDTPRGQQ